MAATRAIAGMAAVTLVWPVPVAAQGGPTCGGYTATVVGTEGPDVIEGTEEQDVIHGLGGDDTILGLDGTDHICGGPGDDALYGGRRELPEIIYEIYEDRVYGNDGNDRVHGTYYTILLGGQGDDVVMHGKASFSEAPAGVDVDLAEGLATGEGTDALVGVWDVIGSAHADSIVGDEGPNTFWGGAGDDVLSGRRDGDYLIGDEGNDRLHGDSGHDVHLQGGGGSDEVLGGFGHDIVSGDGYSTPVEDFGDDVLAGGGGFDRVTYYQGEVAPVRVSLEAGFATGHGVDEVSGFETVEGSSAADRIRGDERDNRLWGMGGEDIIRGGGGEDWLSGPRPLSFSDEDEEDWLIGGAGPDRISVPECCGVLEIIGGPGIDTIVFDPTDPDAFLLAHLDGGYELGRSGGWITGVENLTGTAGTDRIFGDDGPNVLRGLAGRDQLVGGDGRDVLVGGRGHDVVNGSEGRDSCRGVNDRRRDCEREPSS